MNASKVLRIVAALFAFYYPARAADLSAVKNLNLAQTSARKVALVVGNANYKDANKTLPNPANDAQLIAETLKKLGFNVVLKTDLTKSQMKAAFDQVVGLVNPGDVMLFYYAGHGLQLGGKNYLLPVDYSPTRVESFWDIGTAMDEISSKSGINIIVLDACRNDTKGLTDLPSEGVGFTEFRTTSGGTYVAYSTSPGDSAADNGHGGHSPYAEALAKSLLIRPARLEDVFRLTQIEVERVTAGSYRENGRGTQLAGAVVRSPHKYQVPWTSSSLKQVFFFADDEVARLPPPKPAFGGSLHARLLGGLLGGLRPFEFKTPLLNERGSVVQQMPGQAKGFVEPLGMTGMALVEIPGGRFSMGASAAEVGTALSEAKLAAEDGILEDASYQALAAEIPQHAVDVKGFYMSRFEVTQAQYLAVMGRLPGDEGDFRGAQMPVINITWQEANDFCARLSQITGRSYRLPTEAEWEYAARAGTTTPFAFGETLNPQTAIYNSAIPYGKGPRGAARRGPTGVGELTPSNAFGLVDMSGNVWEWVADYWHNSYDGAPRDGSAWDEPQTVYDDKEEEDVLDQSRIVRGGSWFSPAAGCRSATRFRFFPSTRANNVGFRVVVQ
jgi:formylglycine-generating enzyme required for sulfatase activity